MPIQNCDWRILRRSGQDRSSLFQRDAVPRRRHFRCLPGLILLAGLAGSALAGSAHLEIRNSGLFPEKGLESRVDFWEAVFTRYGRNEALLHDRQEVGLIYEVLQLEGDAEHDEAARRSQQQAVRSRVTAWEDRLRGLARTLREGATPPESDQALLARLQPYLGLGPRPEALEDLADRIHVHRGVREMYGEGWVRAGRYLPHMQGIFDEMGVPDEILAIPFFESSFRLDSRSRKQATGVWQFIRSTGKLFLKIDRHFDERLDPLLSTRGAGRYLLDAYGKLGSWPLAVMAYNHGLYGILRAKSTFGNNHLAIINYYSSSQFGYASRNYYPEFLAALRLLRDPQSHFDGLVPEKPWRFQEAPLANKMTLAAVLKKHRLDLDSFLEWNPSVIRPRAHLSSTLPAGFRLRLPAEAASAEPSAPTLPANTAAASAQPASPTKASPVPAVRTTPGPVQPTAAKPAAGRITAAPKPVRTHVVQAGETLYRLSVMYKTSVTQLRRWNNLRDNTIKTGQRLIVGK